MDQTTCCGAGHSAGRGIDRGAERGIGRYAGRGVGRGVDRGAGRGAGRGVDRGAGRLLIAAAAVAALTACQAARSTVQPPAGTWSSPASVSPQASGLARPSGSTAPAAAGSPAGTRGLPAGAHQAYLTAVDPAGHTVTVDPVDWFTGAEAAAACQRDGVQPDAEWCNDYYIRNRSRATALVTVAAGAKIRAYHLPGSTEMCPDADGVVGLCDLDLVGLQRVLAENRVPMLAAVTVTGRAATSIEEIFLP